MAPLTSAETRPHPAQEPGQVQILLCSCLLQMGPVLRLAHRLQNYFILHQLVTGISVLLTDGCFLMIKLTDRSSSCCYICVLFLFETVTFRIGSNYPRVCSARVRINLSWVSFLKMNLCTSALGAFSTSTKPLLLTIRKCYN